MDDYLELAEVLQDPSFDEVIEGLDVFTDDTDNLYGEED